MLLLDQVVAAMLLVSAAIGLVAGPLADRCGRRRVILLGLVSAPTPNALLRTAVGAAL